MEKHNSCAATKYKKKGDVTTVVISTEPGSQGKNIT